MNVQAAINAGLFTQFVYDNYTDANPTIDLNGRVFTIPPLNPGDPIKSYQVLRTIYANDLATDLTVSRPSIFKTIGIVASNLNDPLDAYIAVRGTKGIWEWIEDLKFLPRSFPNVHGAGLTEDGFTDMYLSFSLTPSPLPTGTTFIQEVVALLDSRTMVTVTGHSLGAALATLLALDLAAHSTFPLSVYTLASPRVGDLTFSHLFNHIVPNAYRVHNRLDIVTKTPPPLLYFHVGDETELVPNSHLLKFTLPCEHHLTTYLNLLATLIGSQAQYPLDGDCVA